MTRRFASALAGFILVILVAGPEAQQAPAFGNAGRGDQPRRRHARRADDVQLLVGRSTILDIGSTIARVSLTVPDVADAMVTAPTQLLIHGKQPGTISMFVWDRMGAITTYEVIVRRDLSALVEQVKNLFPGEAITVAGSGKDVVISGTVSSKYVMDKAADVAGGYVEKKENVVNLLKQAEGVASNQVMLKVRFAEVSRNALQELGASLFSDGNNSLFGRTTTQQFAAPLLRQEPAERRAGRHDGVQRLPEPVPVRRQEQDRRRGQGAAVQGRVPEPGRAEPDRARTARKPASSPAVNSRIRCHRASSASFTIHFKEYGVRLTFTPTVLGGDLINLKIKPEVSSLDFNNAVVIEGFRIPALTSRRAETEVELQDGQTFAIAGLHEQHRAVVDAQGARSRRHPGPRLPVQEPRVSEGPDRAGRDGDADDRAPRSTGVSAGLPSLVEPFLGPNEKPLAAARRRMSDRPVHRCAEGGGWRRRPAPAPCARAAANSPAAARVSESGSVDADPGDGDLPAGEPRSNAAARDAAPTAVAPEPPNR